MNPVRAAVLLVVVGCYRPHAPVSCEIACGPASECPDGTSCDNGRCRGDGADLCVPGDANGEDGDGSPPLTFCDQAPATAVFCADFDSANTGLGHFSGGDISAGATVSTAMDNGS